MQEQPLGKTSLSEGSDPTPCKEPVSRHPCAPSCTISHHAADFCCLLPWSLLGVSPSHGAWALPSPPPGGLAMGRALHGGGNAAFTHSSWGTLFPPNPPGYASLMPTYTQRDKAPCAWQLAPHPAERAPHHRFPCLECPSPTRLWDFALSVFARCIAEVSH